LDSLHKLDLEIDKIEDQRDKLDAQAQKLNTKWAKLVDKSEERWEKIWDKIHAKLQVTDEHCLIYNQKANTIEEYEEKCGQC